MLSITKKNNAASPENTNIINVVLTTVSRVGQTILNHSERTDLINSIIFFIFFPVFCNILQVFLAGAEGIEPSSAVLETDILPLNYAPVAAFFSPTYRMPLYTVRKRIAHKYKKSSGNIIIFLLVLCKKNLIGRFCNFYISFFLA